MSAIWLPSAMASLAALTMNTAAIEPVKTQIADAPIAPNLTDAATEVLDLDTEANQRLTIPVTIDGAGPYDFMIDTGSQATAVTHRINEALQLESNGTATLVGMASSRQVDLVELDNLEVGTRVINNLSAPVLYRKHVGADGIIGLDSLQDMRVLIDFRDETIAVADATEGSSSRGFEIIVRARHKLGQLLITNAKIEGVKTTVIIDTGAQGSLGNLALQKRIRARRAQQVTATDVNGVTLQGEMSIARRMEIQGLTLTNMPITFADAPAFEALGLKDKPVISLGMQHLKVFDRVAIDFAKQRILFDLPSKYRMRRANREASRQAGPSRR
ncbi:MAG: aspartyl protease family protein [Erythrobacter sp.]